MLALTTRPAARAGRERIAYGDLGRRAARRRVRACCSTSSRPRGPASRLSLHQSGRRKATGTFYTPRAMTEYLVRRTLAPLVRDACPSGSWRFGSSIPRWAAALSSWPPVATSPRAYEAALVREGSARRTSRRRTGPAFQAGDRPAMSVRRRHQSDGRATGPAIAVARHARADRPLTFLDHHLRAATAWSARPWDVPRQPPPAGGAAADSQLPLLTGMIDRDMWSIASRLSLAGEPGDTLEQVRAKERLSRGCSTRLAAGAWKRSRTSGAGLVRTARRSRRGVWPACRRTARRAGPLCLHACLDRCWPTSGRSPTANDSFIGSSNSRRCSTTGTGSLRRPRV